MILAKTPFRISFVGGGSDLPQFYRRRTGTVVSATIDKSMYIAIHPYFHDKIRIKYSRTEDVSSIEEIEHPLVRECLRMLDIGCGMEIASIADVPAGTGMGSSSAFTVGLLHALNALAGRNAGPERLAEAACHVEIDRVAEPIGKQDQYASAYGGLNLISFHPDETVEVRPLACATPTREELGSRLMLFYVGQERAASSILSEQSRNMADAKKFGLVARMTELAEELASELDKNRLDAFGAILDEGWRLKSRVASDITNDVIESNYRRAREAGAEGGKILGAGGGGFLLLYAKREKQGQVREALAHLREMPFAMSTEGSRILCNDGQNEPILARSVMSSARG
jgi:D-glycero-alpha-D-manno-heptose-7-phosphate kinase